MAANIKDMTSHHPVTGQRGRNRRGRVVNQSTHIARLIVLASAVALVACGTSNAARAIRRPDLGSLKPGSVGDASIFEVLTEPTQYKDVVGEVITGEHRFAARGLVLSGQWWH